MKGSFKYRFDYVARKSSTRRFAAVLCFTLLLCTIPIVASAKTSEGIDSPPGATELPFALSGVAALDIVKPGTTNLPQLRTQSGEVRPNVIIPGRVGIGVADPGSAILAVVNPNLSGGTIGIGTTNPKAIIQYAGNGASPVPSNTFIWANQWYLNPGYDKWANLLVASPDGNGCCGSVISSYWDNGSNPYGILSLGTLGYSGVTHTLNIKNGTVGIGTTNPHSALQVDGEVQVGDSGVACTSSNAGAQRYVPTSKVMEYCNGTSWMLFAPVTVPVYSNSCGGEKCGQAGYVTNADLQMTANHLCQAAGYNQASSWSVGGGGGAFRFWNGGGWQNLDQSCSHCNGWSSITCQ